MNTDKLTEEFINLGKLVATQIAVQRGTNEKIDFALCEIKNCKEIQKEHGNDITDLKGNIKFIGWCVVILTTIITGVKVAGFI